MTRTAIPVLEIAERYAEVGAPFRDTHYRERDVMTLGEAIPGDGRGLRTYRVGPTVVSAMMASMILQAGDWTILNSFLLRGAKQFSPTRGR